MTSPLLARAGFSHAFFTRNGGCSAGRYDSLNFSYAVGDDSERVDQNLLRAAQVLGVPVQRLYFLAQVHGKRVVDIDAYLPHADVLSQEGDALCSGLEGLACAVRTADCVPILLADISTGRVAAVHAGWRGLVAGIPAAAVAALQVDPQRCIAAIGPHISATHFEVSEEVAKEIASCCNSPQAVLYRPGCPRPFADLRCVARCQLEAAGLERHNIDDVLGCTLGDASRFFSFRRDGRYSGRHLSAIVPVLRPEVRT